MAGHPASEEQRKKTSAALKGRVRSPEHCQHISEAKTGKPRNNPPDWIGPMTGRKHSEETKRKMSEMRKGKKRNPEHIKKWVKTRKERNGYVVSEEQRQKTSKTLTGTKQSEETKAKRSIAMTRIYELYPELRLKTSHFGSDHWNWQGGKSFEQYPQEFFEKRETIREIHEVCALCGKTVEENREELSVHHIDYNKHNNEDENLISLCRKCHIATNSHRDVWPSFFRELKLQMSKQC